MRKISTFIIITFSLIVLYHFINEGQGIAVWAYFLVLAGMYYAKWFREAVLMCALIGIYIIIKYMNYYPQICIITCIIFIAIIPVPYFYLRKRDETKDALSIRNIKMKEKYTDIITVHSNSIEEVQKYEESIERIMQLYIIGRDLTKSLTFDEYAETLLRALSNRAGVVSVNIFGRDKNEWQPLAFSKPYQKNDWVVYMQFNKSLQNENNYVITQNPVFCSRDFKTVFWPLKIENEFLGCIIIVCEKKYARRYIKEGAIFCPQISLCTKRVRLFQEISERSRNDGLTGLYLKRYFMERLQSEIQREKRYSGGFYILMLDIDHFKKINDKYGHLAGDKVLCSIAKVIVDCSRLGDLVGRYGGEEFIVFMPMATLYEARAVAQEINKIVESRKFHEGDEEFRVTISIGVSNYPNDGATTDSIINAADKALYKAKQNGRNQFVIYDKNMVF